VKEAIRKSSRSLKRDGLEHRLEIARAPDDVDRALGPFFALHRARAHLTSTVRHPDVFRSKAARGFLRDVCAGLARRDAVRVLQLRIGGEIVASRVAFAIGDTLYLYFSGYAPEWGRYRVTTTVVVEAIKSAIREGLAHVHLSFGTDVSKTRWRPEKIVYRDAVRLSAKARGRIAYGAYRLLQSGVAARSSGGVLRKLFGGRATHG
jgi:CelD/BcsL family acetyltransferase involved in cellulose biosynthesis